MTVKTIAVEHKPVAITTTNYSAIAALSLAFLAGLILNIMPCVLPVIPLKVLSIFEQAKESKARCIALGLMFCLGILLFFSALAGVNIVLRIFYETAFQWGDHFRRPIVLIGMSLLMVTLALFMFGVFNVGVPSSVAGRSSTGKGYAGSVSMGFLAAILSTPCSFAILTAAFAWAQTQPLPLATAAIMAIGVGMASPYAILTSMPGLLKYLPKPGRWMELFKQAMGFVLLLVAIWLIMALSEERRTGVLYFAVVLGLCVWMWGGWVNFNTPMVRKWIIRTIAGAIAIGTGLLLLPKPAPSQISWLDYDRDVIKIAVDANQPVLIEFMADWCLTCKAIEKTVYKRKDISDLIAAKGVLAVQADTTEKKMPATIDLYRIYKEPGVPVSILYIPGIEQPERLHGMLIGDKLKKLLESLADKANAP
jgi:thiol:disulfide interchange protein DsbD